MNVKKIVIADLKFFLKKPTRKRQFYAQMRLFIKIKVFLIYSINCYSLGDEMLLE